MLDKTRQDKTRLASAGALVFAMTLVLGVAAEPGTGTATLTSTDGNVEVAIGEGRSFSVACPTCAGVGGVSCDGVGVKAEGGRCVSTATETCNDGTESEVTSSIVISQAHGISANLVWLGFVVRGTTGKVRLA
jgi:hypothetical protein